MHRLSDRILTYSTGSRPNEYKLRSISHMPPAQRSVNSMLQTLFEKPINRVCARFSSCCRSTTCNLISLLTGLMKLRLAMSLFAVAE